MAGCDGVQLDGKSAGQQVREQAVAHSSNSIGGSDDCDGVWLKERTQSGAGWRRRIDLSYG